MKKAVKTVLSFLLIFTFALSLIACGNGGTNQTNADTTDAETDAVTDTTDAETDAETDDVQPADRTDVRFAVLAGPTGMGAASLMAENEADRTANRYTFTVSTAPTEVTAGLINGSYDIAAVPTNLAATLYQKTSGGVRVLACNTLGVLYMLEQGESVQSMEDLRGKTIYATGQGATPEYVLRYLLSKNGLDPDTDVTIEYYAEHAELATLMANGTVSLGLLPEPNVTVVRNSAENVRIALNLTDEWKAVSEDSELIMGCVVVRTQFAEEHPEAVEAFLNEYQASIAYAQENTESAAALIAQYGIVAKEALAAKALPNCNLCFLSGEEMKVKLSGFLKVLYEANPASVGGSLPDDAFYYAK